MTRWRNQKGFTIPELLVSVAVVGLLLAAVLLIHQGTLQTYVFNSTSTETQQNARFALDRMAREIRQASAITTAAATSITFTAQDGVTVVTYALTGTTLTRNSQTVVGGGGGSDVRLPGRRRCHRRHRGQHPAGRHHHPDTK